MPGLVNIAMSEYNIQNWSSVFGGLSATPGLKLDVIGHDMSSRNPRDAIIQWILQTAVRAMQRRCVRECSRPNCAVRWQAVHSHIE